MRNNIVNRDLLRDELRKASQISDFAQNTNVFRGEAGIGGLAAQLATAGIGAYAQNKARKALAEQELQSQQQFSELNPDLANYAEQLGPEARENIMLKRALLETEKKFGSPKEPLVNVQTGEIETEERKALGKIFAKKYDSISIAGNQAQDSLDTLETLEQAVINPDVAQGAFAGIRQQGKKVLDLFGFDPKGLEDEAIINSIGNRLALQLRSPKGEDGGLTGNTSDRDLSFLIASVPGKDKTMEQNIALIEIAKKDKERTLKLKNLAEQYLMEKGTFQGFAKVKKEFFKQNPLYEEGSDEKETIKRLIKGEIGIASQQEDSRNAVESSGIKFLGME